MTFNPQSDISGSQVRRGGSGRRTGLAIGGGGLGIVLIFVIAQFTGVDISGFLGEQDSTAESPVIEGASLDECRTGADANASVDCRMAGAAVSLEDFWVGEFPEIAPGTAYSTPGFELFSGRVNTACGAASSATGPFYCPGDRTIYIDTTFYDQLRSQFGAQGGPLSELYIVAHEWGHHIQKLEGTFDSVDRRETGPLSGTVRIELQADCYAGAWVGAASSTRDKNGATLLQPPTDDQIRDALDAAATVGDDRIQQQATGGVDPEGWTHGSSEQRQRWFLTGYQGGATTCNTFAAGGRL
ncbi:KPN_02809 family neutral zinc metallopeptidase [Mycetocola spongiae]|uniref:KPN_02809 family neutral zinc metallopeptidase n=1 Tax=Mycetocola spongiae TaxID=2859226 RepID=UPI001CF1F34A|nr:neutral zinc metallopeptidase [Mycetocola spongiae]UCR88487.1 neutral zinc metallopeptidase [Mycetocola spongiae]